MKSPAVEGDLSVGVSKGKQTSSLCSGRFVALIQVLCDLAHLKSSRPLTSVSEIPDQFSSSVLDVCGSRLVCEECESLCATKRVGWEFTFL